jgi:hypothetical protein
MDDLVQNPEAQKLAQMLQQQQMQKFLQQIQGAGSGMGAMSELDRQQMQSQSSPMFAQPMPQGEFNQRPVPMLGQPMPQGSMGGRPVPMPNVNGFQGAMSDLDRRMLMQQGMGQGAMSNADYEMMRKMPR